MTTLPNTQPPAWRHTAPVPAVTVPVARPTSLDRVLHVINGEHYAGAERVQDLLAQRLPEFGFEVAFACVKPDKFPEMRQCKEATVYTTPMRHSFDLRAAWRVAKLAREGEFRLLHCHTPRSALIASLASRLSGVPMVFHVHSPTARDSTRRWRNWINQWVERLSVARAARLITVSHSLARHMQQHGVPAGRISVVPNGTPAVDELQERTPPDRTWTLGTVALFRPRKGLEILLDAVHRLERRGLSVRLRAVGEFESPEYRKQIMELAERELEVDDLVDWTGFAQDVDGELSRMDVMVLPSLFGEGLPMVVLEAMARGVPVVATDVEGVPEVLRDGVDGLIVPPGSAETLTERLEQLMLGKYDWSKLRRNGWERHRGHFSDRAMAEGVARVYRKLLD